MLRATRLDELCVTADGLTTRFQPIVSLAGNGCPVPSLECLTRGPAGTHFESPDALFGAARRDGLIPHLDRACISAALDAAAGHALPQHLFLNVHPETLQVDPLFSAFLVAAAARRGIAAERLTLELVERGRIAITGQMRRTLDALRARGVRLALDDFGIGGCDHVVLSQCAPDFVKVDGALVRTAWRHAGARLRLRTVVAACVRRGAELIAEGIEGARDLDTARDMGIALGQGFFLGLPDAAPVFAGGVVRGAA